MHILINPKNFDKKRFEGLEKLLPDVTFTNDLNDISIDAIITWSNALIPKVLDRYPNLKLAMLPSAGYDKADVAYLRKRQIILTNARGVYDIQIAEDVIAKMLYFNRDMMGYQKLMYNASWEPKNVFFDIFGQTIGIVGAGSIGRRIAKVLGGFDAHIIGYRRNESPLPEFDEILTGDDGLADLLKRSDYVILAVPLNKHTTHMINENALKMMKKEALLINIARGDVIEQNALIKALNEEWIRGAALDVVTPEPLPSDHPLWCAKNVFISPHVAGNSPKAHARVDSLLARVIRQYLDEEPIDNRIC